MEPNAITKHIAYGQYSNLERVRDAFIDDKLKLPLDADSLRDLDIPDSSIFSTKRSLEDITWFTNGHPTDLFIRLAHAYQTSRSDYQGILKTLLHDLYREVFGYIAHHQINLAYATAAQLEAAFSGYEPQNQHRRMAYLFLAFAREANIIPDVRKISHLANGKFAPKSGQVSVSKEGTSMDDLPQVRVNGRNAMHQDAKITRIERQRQYVKELLDALPDEEGQDREWWVDALKSNVDLLIKLFVRKDEGMKT